MLGEPTPHEADPIGHMLAFERRVAKAGRRDGLPDRGGNLHSMRHGRNEMTIVSGAIINGPEHRSSWVRDCLDRVTGLLGAASTGPGQIGLIWHIGGSPGEPGWVGPGKARPDGLVIAMHVGVPRSVQDVDLEGTMLAFVDEAIDRAGDLLVATRRPFDRSGHDAVVESARARVEQLTPPAIRREAFRPFEDRFARRKATLESTARVYAEPKPGPSMPQFAFISSTQEEVDRLFSFEEELDQALQAAGLGSVDGNEIGTDTFVLFISPKRGRGKEAVRLVTDLIDRTPGVIAAEGRVEA